MFEDFLDDEELENLIDAQAGDVDSFIPSNTNPSCTGHEEIEKALLGLVNSGSVPHALIFAGPEGVGKSIMAYRLARYLLKHGAGAQEQDGLFGGDEPLKATSLDMDEDDPVFRKVAAGGHPDFMGVARAEDERKGGLKELLDIETIRKIAPFLRMTASEGGWRVVLVDDADRMNRNAQNGLLKILEEPPAKTVLILVTHRTGALIPTIRSRCRVVSFKPLEEQALRELLQKGCPDLSSEDLKTISAMAEGSLGRAIKLVEEGGMDSLRDVIALFEGWPKWNWTSIHLISDRLGRQTAEYHGFVFALCWLLDSLLRDKARENFETADLLGSDKLKAFQDHFSLGQLSRFCETVKIHFEQAERSNLDKKQAVLGVFSVIE